MIKLQKLFSYLRQDPISLKSLPYTNDEIYRVIAVLLPIDKIKLQKLFGANYDEIIATDDVDLVTSVLTEIIPKISSMLARNFENVKPNTNNDNYLLNQPLEANSVVDPLWALRNILGTQTLHDVEGYLSKEEAIILNLRLGTTIFGTYTPLELAKMFNMSLDDVVNLLETATYKYMQCFNDKLKESATQAKIYQLGTKYE